MCEMSKLSNPVSLSSKLLGLILLHCFRGDEGMEMQMLRLGGMAAQGSDNESVTSLEYHKPNNSTIGNKYFCILLYQNDYYSKNINNVTNFLSLQI